MVRNKVEKTSPLIGTACVIALGVWWRRKARLPNDQSAKLQRGLLTAALIMLSAVSTPTTAQMVSFPRLAFPDAETGWGCRFTGGCGSSRSFARCTGTKSTAQNSGCDGSSSGTPDRPQSLRSHRTEPGHIGSTSR